MSGAVPLSQSGIWEWQRSYYEREGIEAWTSGTVPSFITTNTFIAQAYARVIRAYLEELEEPGTVRVVELGAGHGRFGFLLLSRLLADLPDRRLRYVMTDVAESNLAFLESHPQLQPWLVSDVLDLARFDCERDSSIVLRRSGEELAGPIVVIANYIFDSLVQDAYRVHDGELEEGLVTVEGDPAEAVDDVQLRYEHVPVPAARYGDPALDDVLADYGRSLADTSFPFPVGTLRCLATLRELSGDRLLLLSADKGYTHPSQLLAHDDPQLVTHGSFSFSVDFHAIGAYVRHHGGGAWTTAARDSSLSCAGFVLGEGSFERTALAFAEHIEGFGPIDFFALSEAVVPAAATLGLPALLAFLRMSDYDPRLLFQLSEALLDLVDGATEDQRLELRRVLARAWERYFPLGEGDDVPFELGRLYAQLELHREALRFYERSLRRFGEDRATFHNMGMAHHGLGDLDEALRCFDRALELDPADSSARSWRMRLLAERESSA